MTAVGIDGRAVGALRVGLPGLHAVQADVLALDWAASVASLAATPAAGGVRRPLAVVGNLPNNIVAQILLSLLETPAGVVATTTVMVQTEVADRLVAPPRCKAYGILSVVAQLYASPTILFGVPPTAFTRRPTCSRPWSASTCGPSRRGWRGLCTTAPPCGGLCARHSNNAQTLRNRPKGASTGGRRRRGGRSGLPAAEEFVAPSCGARREWYGGGGRRRR
eukprot:TRINITY_DN5329_c0_g1_i1.p3 TRINITY_DN5329_c0_g1~~TRINITY_DN5329_c0_g1_i1.p3  ORF type:complete len:221 (-),score=45.89 TRINITY_DN5329_c0_g1_i1:343-1005(-)